MSEYEKWFQREVPPAVNNNRGRNAPRLNWIPQPVPKNSQGVPILEDGIMIAGLTPETFLRVKLEEYGYTGNTLDEIAAKWAAVYDNTGMLPAWICKLLTSEERKNAELDWTLYEVPRYHNGDMVTDAMDFLNETAGLNCNNPETYLRLQCEYRNIPEPQAEKIIEDYTTRGVLPSWLYALALQHANPVANERNK